MRMAGTGTSSSLMCSLWSRKLHRHRLASPHLSYSLSGDPRACWIWWRRHGKNNHPLSEPPLNISRKCRTTSKGPCPTSTCSRPKLSRAGSTIALPSPGSSTAALELPHFVCVICLAHTKSMLQPFDTHLEWPYGKHAKYPSKYRTEECWCATFKNVWGGTTQGKASIFPLLLEKRFWSRNSLLQHGTLHLIN